MLTRSRARSCTMSNVNGVTPIVQVPNPADTNTNENQNNNDVLDDEIQDIEPLHNLQSRENTPSVLTQSEMASRATSTQSLLDLDIDEIHQKSAELLKIQYAQLSADELNQYHGVVLKLISDLNIQFGNRPEEIANAVDSVNEELESIKNTIIRLKLGNRTPTPHDFVSNEGQEELFSEVTNQIKLYIECHKNSLISEVAARVLQEYTHYSLKCATSKNEIKRSINALRTDMNVIYSNKQQTEVLVDELRKLTEKLEEKLIKSNSTVNTNFRHCADEILYLRKTVDDLSQRLQSVEGQLKDKSRSSNPSQPAEQVTPITELIDSSQHRSSEQNSTRAESGRTILDHNLLRNGREEHRERNMQDFPQASDPRINLPNPHTSANTSTSSYQIPAHKNPDAQARRKKYVLMNISLINKIISQDLSQASKADTIKLVSFDLKKLLGFKADLKRSQEALSVECSDSQLLDTVDDTMQKILLWEDTLMDLQKSHYLHLSSDRSMLKKVDLKPFDGTTNNDTIYHFLNIFNSLSDLCHSPEEKSQLLYKSYLAQNIRVEIEALMPNFDSIVNYLINEYGDIRRISAEKKRKIATMKHPTDSHTPQQHVDYYKSVENILCQCESLATLPDINSAEVSAAIYSSEFVEGIVSYLPKQIIDKFSRTLGEEPRIPHPSGVKYYEILKSTITAEWRHIARVSNISTIKDIASDTTKKSTKLQQVSHVNDHKKQTKQDDKNKTSNKPKTKLNHPCPFHPKSITAHELGQCRLFFKGHNKNRIKLCTENKVCITCLTKSCYTPSSPCTATMPSTLICSQCKEKKDSKPRVPNVLCCPNADHKRPTLSELNLALNQYLGIINYTLIENIKDQFNLMILNVNQNSLSESKPRTGSSGIDPSAKIPAFDSATGKLVQQTSSVKFPSNEDSLYIFQQLKLGGREVLAFWDSGASGNLIRGELAESLRFKVIDPESQLVGCLGNRTFYTNYGIYCCQIGPDSFGDYHQLTFQGISSITNEFPHYQLKDIANEVRETSQLPPETALPIYVGGRPVDILFGIKCPELQPRLLFWLPSGIGVFQMPLTDQFSSSIAFGGSHSSISKANKDFENFSFNHISVMLSRLASQYMESPFLDLNYIPPSKTPFFAQLSDHQSALTATTPISGGDLLELNGRFEVDPLIFSTSTDCLSCNISSCEHHSGHVTESEVGHLTRIDSHKSKIPLAKIRENRDSADDLISYRCPECENCTECKKSTRLKSSTLRERVEQRLIESSVIINYDEKRTYVKLPFLSDPVAFFKKQFNSSSNYRQALSVYFSQCKKSPEYKAQLQAVMSELAQANFIQEVSTLPQELQDLISQSPVQHIYPWRSVHKDSLTTPCRIIVDPTSSSLNLICAKGDPNLSSLYGILLDARCLPYIFASDIRKLYNTMYLLPESLPFSLFLYDHSLDQNIKPSLWIMTRAWYGVISTSAQASTALRRLGADHKSSHPLGAEVLQKKVYVDDSVAGSLSKELRETQIDETQHILGNGGMSLKYIVRSGEAPPQESTKDGTHVSLLGYKWDPMEDILSLDIQEVNFSKKHRGLKKENPFPANDPASINRLISSLPKLTRRLVVAKCAELYDMLGLIEPYKAQLKRALSDLNHFDWDVKLPQQEQDRWTEFLMQWPDIANLKFPRACIPENASQPLELRLICCCDASATCGGAALYASFRLTSGKWSCTLLSSKSQLLKYSIPKNELQAVVIGLELTYAAVLSLSHPIAEIIIATDSIVSLCWCSNPDARNKVFVQNRVLTAHRYIDWITSKLQSDSSLHLVHIPGNVNIADIITKGVIHPYHLGPNSKWLNGFPWMSDDLSNMPIKSYQDIAISQADLQEVRKEQSGVEVSNCLSSASSTLFCTMTGEFGEFRGLILPPIVLTQPKITINVARQHKTKSIDASNLPIVDVIGLGWRRACLRMTYIIRFCIILIHKTHLKLDRLGKSSVSLAKCIICNINKERTSAEASKMREVLSIDHLPSENHDQSSDNACISFQDSLVNAESSLLDQYWNLLASRDCKQRLGKKDLEKCQEDPNSGILYYKARIDSGQNIASTDLDLLNLDFLDKHDLQFHHAVILSDHPIFYAYCIYAHYTIDPHSSLESTLKAIHKRFYPFYSREVVSRILADCVKCRLLKKKLLEFEMANHSSLRFNIAPPFCFSMIDLAQHFKCKTRWVGRQTFNIPALVMVCILTGAVAIYMCEDWSSDSLLQALERHAGRFGVPSILHVDSGSQMISLQEATFDLKALSGHVKQKMSCEVVVAPPKSHSHQGRVERKILHMRQLLDKLGESGFILSFLGWESLMSKVASTINSLPVCRPSARSVKSKELDIVTPNHFIMGFNSKRSLSGPMLIDIAPSACLQRSIEAQEFFYDLLLQQTHLFIPKSKWFNSSTLLIGDICLFYFQEANLKARNVTWHYGRVISITKSHVTLSYATGKILERSFRQIVRVCAEEELIFNSKSHYEKISK